MALCWYKRAEESCAGDRDLCQPMPFQEPSWPCSLPQPRLQAQLEKAGSWPGMQEVSHRGREIAGLGVWAATVTVFLQNGCGFADRESAAWTCQWCRSEVSMGEPGPPRPYHSHQDPTRVWHLLLISCPSAQRRVRTRSPPAQLHIMQKEQRGQKRQRVAPLTGQRAKYRKKRFAVVS